MKNKKKSSPEKKSGGAGKPVSLWGPSFKDVLAALLRTRAKKTSKKEDGGPEREVTK